MRLGLVAKLSILVFVCGLDRDSILICKALASIGRSLQWIVTIVIMYLALLYRTLNSNEDQPVRPSQWLSKTATGRNRMFPHHDDAMTSRRILDP